MNKNNFLYGVLLTLSCNFTYGSFLERHQHQNLNVVSDQGKKEIVDAEMAAFVSGVCNFGIIPAIHHMIANLELNITSRDTCKTMLSLALYEWNGRKSNIQEQMASWQSNATPSLASRLGTELQNSLTVGTYKLAADLDKMVIRCGFGNSFVVRVFNNAIVVQELNEVYIE